MEMSDQFYKNIYALYDYATQVDYHQPPHLSPILEDAKLQIAFETPSSSRFSWIRESRSSESSTSSLPASTNPHQRACGFCKRNGERPEVFMSHSTKVNGKVTCPYLQSHKCELCGATGEYAHTRSYCLEASYQRGIQREGKDSYKYYNQVALKKTQRNSAGKKRTFGRS